MQFYKYVTIEVENYYIHRQTAKNKKRKAKLNKAHIKNRKNENSKRINAFWD